MYILLYFKKYEKYTNSFKSLYELISKFSIFTVDRAAGTLAQSKIICKICELTVRRLNFLATSVTLKKLKDFAEWSLTWSPLFEALFITTHAWLIVHSLDEIRIIFFGIVYARIITFFCNRILVSRQLDVTLEKNKIEYAKITFFKYYLEMHNILSNCYSEIYYETRWNLLNMKDVKGILWALSGVLQLAIITVFHTAFVRAFIVTAPIILLFLFVWIVYFCYLTYSCCCILWYKLYAYRARSDISDTTLFVHYYRNGFGNILTDLWE
jgi:hypothetical protein